MDLDERWARWHRRFGEADRDIRNLFHNRHVWLTINEMWERNAEAIQLNTLVANWYLHLYVTTQCTGIRRECDPGERTSSLENCLRELIKYPAMSDRSRFEARVDANPEIPAKFKEVNKLKFNAYATADGSPDLDVSKIEEDLVRLRDAASAARTYTNKIIAHRESRTVRIDLAWADLDGALNAVGEVLKKYYSLWNAAVIKGNLTPDLPLGWERPYEVAWWPEGMQTPNAKSLDAYIRDAQQDGSH